VALAKGGDSPLPLDCEHAQTRVPVCTTYDMQHITVSALSPAERTKHAAQIEMGGSIRSICAVHALRATFAVSPRTMAPQKKGAG
jgi:hypothetical protein